MYNIKEKHRLIVNILVNLCKSINELKNIKVPLQDTIKIKI